MELRWAVVAVNSEQIKSYMEYMGCGLTKANQFFNFMIQRLKNGVQYLLIL